MMDIDAFRKINHIIEFDATASTYKFVLLKTVIEAIQKYDHLMEFEESNVKIPLGLVVEGWIFAYLPFVFSGISQQNKRDVLLNKQIDNAYRTLFETFQISNRMHNWREAYNIVLYKYKSANLTQLQKKAFIRLAKLCATTIKNMPMRYIGSENYEIFRPCEKNERTNLRDFNRVSLIDSFGKFEVDFPIYQVFRYFGQTLYGTVTIAERWKEKTCKLNTNLCSGHLDLEEMIFDRIEDERSTKVVRDLLPDEVECIWSGKKLNKQDCDIDHVLPFTIWHNNDLWNLMPSSPMINNKKRDKIPAPSLILSRKKFILRYWDLYESQEQETFRIQILTSLGSKYDKELLFESLVNKSKYLIDDLGMEAFYL